MDAQQPEQEHPEQELASWVRRVVALGIDGVIVGGLVLTTMLVAGVPLDDVNSTLWDGSSLTVIALFVLPEAIYDTAMIGARSQTFGKMALGIKVVDAESRSSIGYSRAFTRWLTTSVLWALWAIPGILDHLWPLRDRRNQTFHDKFARSVVVRT